jgi:hypothetical protein
LTLTAIEKQSFTGLKPRQPILRLFKRGSLRPYVLVAKEDNLLRGACSLGCRAPHTIINRDPAGGRTAAAELTPASSAGASFVLDRVAGSGNESHRVAVRAVKLFSTGGRRRRAAVATRTP